MCRLRSAACTASSFFSFRQRRQGRPPRGALRRVRPELLTDMPASVSDSRAPTGDPQDQDDERQLTGLPWNHARSRRAGPLHRWLVDNAATAELPARSSLATRHDACRAPAVQHVLRWAHDLDTPGMRRDCVCAAATYRLPRPRRPGHIVAGQQRLQGTAANRHRTQADGSDRVQAASGAEGCRFESCRGHHESPGQ
jgi:hypothetical protein